MNQSKKRTTVLAWICRICFAFVFIVNVQCALHYVISPADYVGGFQLSGVEGEAAVRGLGIAFLMWNTTYPAFIANPERFKVLGWVILVQQLIGLVGESILFATLPAGYSSLAGSIQSFITFDATGFFLMLVSFFLLLKLR